MRLVAEPDEGLALAADVPGFQGFMRPLLELLVREGDSLRARDAYERVADALELTPEQRNLRLPSGKQRVFENRVGWARTYLSFAGLVDSPSRGRWAISASGRTFLASHEGPIDLRTLATIPAFRDRTRSAPSEGAEIAGVNDDLPLDTPEEQLTKAHARIRASVGEQLRRLLAASRPEFFESAVLDLLGSMGYGTDAEARQRVGQTGDGGIDGIISLDRLGLERVYVQAKRWDSDRPVGPKEIREFYGALAERKATKGVFITTSRYTRDAEAYARNVSGSLVLIDGARLVSLMIDHGVGVSVERTLQVPRIDGDYFED